MGIYDLGSIFDALDRKRCGYITAEQLADFHEALHFTRINQQHIEAAIRDAGGDREKSTVSKDNFLEVLQELDRRQQAEERARWDFMALDRNASYRLNIRDTLLLFRHTQGPYFSMSTWRKFLASREHPNMDVIFEDVKMWLCDPPSGDPCDSNKFTEEEERLAAVTKQGLDDQYDTFNRQKDGDGLHARERAEHEERTKRLARRKYNRWENEGLEAMLYDDGVDRGEDVPERVHQTVSVSSLLNALEYKYDSLRRKLFSEMLQQHFGEAVWFSMSNGDQGEVFEQLILQEKQLRKAGTLRDGVTSLNGHDVSHPAPVPGMIGELPPGWDEQQNELNDRQMQLKSDGKQGAELELLLRGEWESKMKVVTSCGELLIQLAERFQREKEALLDKLRPTDPNVAPTALLSLEFCRMTRQQLLADFEESFMSTAYAIGTAERDHPHTNDNLDLARMYQEMLARERIVQRKGRKLRLPEEHISSFKSVIDKQVALVTSLTWKHAHEREVLINMLIGHESQFARIAAKQLDGDERKRKLTNLRNQRTSWRKSSSDYKLSQKKDHVQLMQEGVGLHYENQSALYVGASENVLNALILADLQLRQDQEFYVLLHAINSKTEKELENEAKTEHRSRKEEDLDNVAATVLGSFEVTEDEKDFIGAIEAKYEMLRQVLLMHAVRAELGLGWDRLSIEEKQRKYMKTRKEESKLRQDGKIEELGALIASLPKEFGSLYALMGENRGQFEQRLQSLFVQQEQAAYKGEDFTKIITDEVPAGQVKSTNHLADLLQRSYAEQDTAITWLRSPEVKANPHLRQRYLVQLKLEHRRAEKEEWFDVCAMSVGLRERARAALDGRHTADNNRQMELARLRVDIRIQRQSMGHAYQKELDEYARPELGDKTAWQEAYMREMDKKFIDERETFLTVLQDPSLEDLCEAAKLMSDTEKCQRLSELRAKRYRLQLENESQRDEIMSILEEAAALRCVMKKGRLLATCPGEELTTDEIAVILLSELQEAQDREIGQTLNSFTNMDEAELQRAREYEIKMRHWCACDNAILVLTKYEGSAQDDELMKALDEKYDALRDKLLLDALMKQMGEADWNLLSKQERQRRLMQLKLKERQLRQQGREDELAALLGEGWAAEEALRKLMGDNRAEYDRKLKERLARRQKRIDQGLDSDEDDAELEEEESTGAGQNPLKDLQHRYEQDKDALLARLRGLNDDFLNEKDRQAELLRLRREALKAQREDNFDNAALLIGLAERQQAAANERLKNDRERQEMLARQRLEAMRKKRGQKDEIPEIALVTEGRSAMEVAVMQQLDEHHSRESVMFAEMIDRCQGEEQLVPATMSELDRQERLAELKEKKAATSPDDVNANQAILQEACRLKVESRRAMLGHKKDGREGDLSLDDLAVSLLADLQEEQEKEAAQYMKDLPDKRDEELVSLQKELIGEKHHVTNIVAVVMKTEDHGKDGEDVLQALDSKYDALRDKLLMESLMAQMGDGDWKKLSEQERQRKLLELKLQERKLRQEGKLDEAAALLGEAIRNHQALDQLMGENKAEQERKLKERLEARKKRKEQGLSDKECDRLEAEEEEEERKRRNILQDLQHNYDQERDELLRRLKAGSSQHEKERQRQLELARLKREQRRAKNEERFDAAAMVLGISREADKKQEADRMRQEQLARERLEARRARQNKALANQETEDISVPDDMNDLIGWQESLVKEVELKHKVERETFIQILESEASQNVATHAQNLSQEERETALEELMIQQQKWRENGRLDDTVNRTLLEEGAGYRIAVVKAALEGENKSSSADDIQIALLADLQQAQDAELQKVMASTEGKTAEVIQQLKVAHSTSRERQWMECAAVVVFGASVDTKTEELSDEEQLIKALNQKYDAARDKLLMEALVKQVGEAEWQQMSERKRQMNLVKLRLEEKKLRSEGRFDEAALLLGQLVENEAELQKKLGESQSDQKRKLEERLKRKKELVAERAAKGLTNDEPILDAIIEAEETEQGKNKKKNILEELQHHYDDEKAALLAAMRKQDGHLASERQRQLEVARLRREEKRLKQEEKFDSAAILLNMAEQHDKKRAENFASERDRQKELARERLEAKRKRLEEKQNLMTNVTAGEMEQKLKLQIEEDKMRGALEEAQIEREGLVALQEAILVEVERKQCAERDMLVDLMATAMDNNSDVKNLNSEWRGVQMEKLKKDHSQWTEKSKSLLNKLKSSGDVTKDQQDAHLAEVAQGRTEQVKILTRAVALRMAGEAEFIGKLQPELSEEAVNVEMRVNILTDLQQKQEAESRALEEVMLKQDEGGLRKMRNVQREVVHEGWMENLDRTIFSIPDTDDIEMNLESDAINTDDVKKQMEEEFEKEKEELEEKLKSAGDNVDMDAAMKELEAQQAAKKKAMNEAMERQRRMAREKLEAKRQARENASYEQDTAVAMVQMVTQQESALTEQAGQEKNRQKNLMDQRLAERREARKQKSEEEAASRQEVAAAAVARPKASDAAFPPSIRSTTMRRMSSPAMSTDGSRRPSLRRTPTTLSLRASDVSEDQKQEIYTQLVREQTALHSKISKDQERQQEILERRLKDRKGRRQNEASALFTLGERQKTVLEQTQKEERERQMTMMKERVARVRYERTMTMKEKGATSAAKFDELVDGDKDTTDLTKDEKMELAAQQMQEQFRKTQKEIQEGKIVLEEDGTPVPQAPAKTPTSSGKLDAQDKMAKLKQRRLAKKQQRLQQEAGDEIKED